MENNTAIKTFIVDDDAFSLARYEQHLLNLGYTDVRCFDNGTECINNLTGEPELILLDHQMNTLNGLDVLKKIKRFNPDICVVFISGQEDVETAVQSLKYGAFDYVVKGDNDLARIEQVLQKMHEVNRLLKRRSKGLLTKLISLF